jgi:hypothetical protein
MIPSETALVGNIINIRKTHQSEIVITVLAGNRLWSEGVEKINYSLTIVDVIHVCQRVLGIIDDQGAPQTIALFRRSVLR